MKAIEDFAAAMRSLYAQEADEAKRWARVRELMPILLDDPMLQAEARTWPLTQTVEGSAANLLLYEDARYGFVINALVKGPDAATPVHDHAHTWTAYGVITGTERVVRYTVVEGDPASGHAKLATSFAYDVAPGFIDIVPPYEPHAETSGDARTIAIIVRSERIGGFLQHMYDPISGTVAHRTGPHQIPFALP
jgi:predicted metal-dependent enzyme (double-stranded beta helix superfamily)